MLTQSRLKELLNYDPDTGVFAWLVKPSKRVNVGAIAGCVMVIGYREIGIDGKSYYAHRLAFLYMTGAWPIDQLDHRNGIRDDNRWDNLREATNAENCQNQVMPCTNKSGFMGVSRFRNKWRARIKIAGREKHLGFFDAPEDARAAYLAAKVEHHAFQPNPRDTTT